MGKKLLLLLLLKMRLFNLFLCVSFIQIISGDTILHDGLSPILPGTLKPLHYDVSLKPDIYNEEPPTTVEGRVVIEFQCLKRTNQLRLHSNVLKIYESSIQMTREVQGEDNLHPAKNSRMDSRHREFDNLHLKGQSSNGLNASDHIAWDKISTHPKWTKIEYLEEIEMIDIYMDREFEEEAIYTVLMDYTARVNRAWEGRGLYWSEIKEGHSTRFMIASHLSPAYARRAFPCFDEPRYKATFTLKVWRKPGVVSLSNMQHHQSYTDSAGWTVDVFDPTPPMSTYLLAVVITDFSSACLPHRNISICLWSERPHSDTAQHVLEASRKFLAYFENLTGIPYMLPKLDLVIIPEIRAQAMEQWGLITFRESAVLYDPREDTCDNFVSKMTSLAHEISHMWFGDLVTPHQWRDLWLKEGLATFLMYRALEAVYPDWDQAQLYVSKSLIPALSLDSSLDAQAVVADRNSWQPANSFNYATSSKAAALFGMLESIADKNTFNDCIRAYLRKFMYSTSSSDDFMNICSEIYVSRGTPVNITRIMKPWIEHKGYPVLSVDFHGNTVNWKQSLYLNEQIEEIIIFDSQLWSFPASFFETVTGRQQMNKLNDGIMDSKSANFTFNSNKNAILIKHYGFYRIAYSYNNVELLAQFLNHHWKEVSVLERALLLDDVFTNALQGSGSSVLPLAMTEYMVRETEYLPWDIFVNHIAYYTAMLHGLPSHELIMNYIGSLLYQHYSEINFEILNHLHHAKNQDIIHSMWAYNIMWTACEINYKPCVEEAVLFFRKFKAVNDVYYINPDIRFTVFCKGIQEGNVTDWDFLYGVLDNPLTDQYRLDILQALACSTEDEILERYMDNILRNPNISSIESLHILSALIVHPSGKQLVWDHLRNYWHFTPLGLYKGSVLLTLAGRFNTASQLKELHDFAETTFDFIFQELINMAISTAETNLQWLELNRDDIELWLNNISQQRTYSSYMDSNNTVRICSQWMLWTVILIANLL